MTTRPIDLLCLPCAGASATMYLRWRTRLPAWIRVIPVELPGRGARIGEANADDFTALVARLHGEHAAVLQRPHAYFGHSMGALLAHAMARLDPPGPGSARLLFVSGSAAPLHRDPARFAGLDSEAALVADLRRQGGTPAEVYANPELLAMTLATLRADYRLCAGHRAVPGLPLACPIHTFAGRQDEIDAACVDAWRLETTAGFAQDWFDGGHFFIKQDESALLAALTNRLAQHVA